MTKTYKPSEQAQKIVDHIRCAARNLSLIELSWLQVAVNKRQEHFCRQFFSGFEFNDPKVIKWSRQQLAEFHWISDQIVEIYRDKANKRPIKRNPILRMPMVVAVQKRHDAKPVKFGQRKGK